LPIPILKTIPLLTLLPKKIYIIATQNSERQEKKKEKGSIKAKKNSK
jgi:hypothetical protein